MRLLAVFIVLANIAHGDTAESNCQRNLKHLFCALAEYKEKYQEHPNSLSDLLPEYVSDPSMLICPTALALRENSAGNSGFVDTSDGLSTYAYELGMTEFIKHNGTRYTIRQFKHLQRAALDDSVPIIRCFRHGNQAINMPFSGRIYRGPRYWELAFTNQRGMPYLLDSLLFKYPQPLVRYLPQRAVGDAACIDLSLNYNALLGDAWFGTAHPVPLEDVSRQARMLGGVPFDARGVVQVGSLIPGNGSYPSRVTVSLGAKVRSVYFLLGCAGYASVGTEVGLIATKVSDPLALVYGKNVIAVDDSGNGLEDPGAVQHTFTLAGKTEPCNLTVLELESEVEFDQVEFEARGTGAAPFMLAITKK